MNKREKRLKKIRNLKRGNAPMSKLNEIYRGHALHGEAQTRKQDATHRRAVLRKKNAIAAKQGIGATHLDHRESRYKDKE